MSARRTGIHAVIFFLLLQLSGCATSEYSSTRAYTANERFAYQRRVASVSMERRNYTGVSYVDDELERARSAHRRQINAERIKRNKYRGASGPDERQRELAEYLRLVESLRIKRRTRF